MLKNLYIPSTSEDSPQQTRQDIDDFFMYLESAGIEQLVIYIHGGLTNKEKAEALSRDKASQLSGPGRHIISIIWETGVLETIQSKVSRALDKTWFKTITPLLERVISKYLKIPTNTGAKGNFRITAQSDTITPINEEELVQLAPILEDEFAKELSLDQSLNAEIISELRRNSDLSESFSSDVISKSSLSPKGAKGFSTSGIILNPARILRKIAVSVLTRYINQTHHNLRQTVVEESLREVYAGGFIKTLWDDMKYRAKDMWERDPTSVDGLARYFLQKLSLHQLNYQNFRVDLIGHSAGSIVICNMLATAAHYYKELTFGKIIFLAPAATMEFLYDEVVTKPERYRQFHIFTMTDEQEKSDVLVQVAGLDIYGYSLLYLISGLLEPLIDRPISGMMRYLTGKSPFDTHKLRRISDFLNSEDERLILSPGVPTRSGLQTESKTHGGFSKDKKTTESICLLLDQLI